MNQPRILIVEDDKNLRDFYKEILENEGYYVEVASDGNIGMEKAKKGGWDLLLLDIILPGIDGITIMKSLKINPPQTPNKKVVFLTNVDNNKQIQEALSLVDGYFIKSKTAPDKLLAQIKVYLGINTGKGQEDTNY